MGREAGRPAGLDRRLPDVGETAHPHGLSIEGGAASPPGGIQLVVDRVVDDADPAQSVAHESHGDAELRDAAHEIGGPVDRVDHPNVRPELAAAFLAIEGIPRKGFVQARADQGFDLRVRRRDVVLVPLEIDLERLRPSAEMRPRQPTRLPGDGGRGEQPDIEIPVGSCHAAPDPSVSRTACPLRAPAVAASASRCALRPSWPVGESALPSSTPATKASSSAR
jgi:hypothetical protein